jgi:hypothetical protein
VSRANVARAILIFGTVSTALHYTHNFVKVDEYPGGGSTVVRVGIVLLWPALTAVGWYGWRLYRDGRFYAAHVCLALWSFLGISTLGHFVAGDPDIPAFFYATIFTDGLSGIAMLAFVVVSARSLRSPLPARA